MVSRNSFPRGARAFLLSFAALVALLSATPWRAPAARAAEPVTITDYTDRSEELAWGQRSHWKQPWRSYLETPPGSALRNAIGINFNVAPKVTPSTARLLAESGFHRARIEIGWNNLDYDDPSHLSAAGAKNLQAYLEAFRENGIRPLILLNANDNQPCPVRTVTLHLTAPAPAGATAIHIDPADVSSIAPGRTGLPLKGNAAFQLITSVSPGGTAQLSRPLGAPYASGAVKAETLLYEPFSSPTLASGAPNPRYQATMAGWLNYVGVVTREAERILGSEDFDVEVWNELSFGSAFLNIDNYYEPDLEPTPAGVTRQMLLRTVAYLRNPAHGVPEIGIGNGFANQRPWDNGTESPLGLSAIDKHPYAGWVPYPGGAQVNGNRPLNGLGELAGWKDTNGQYREDFTPSYDAFFPERFIAGLYTETLIRDLSPFPTQVSHVQHGRFTHPDGGSPPRMWITEVNLDPAGGPVSPTQMSEADIRHVETKEVLRYFTAFVNKGAEVVDIFAASAGHLSVIDKAFMQAANGSPSTYPGSELGGETVAAVRRLTDAMKGSRISEPRSLELRALTDFNSNVQFAGDPQDPVHYPPLYNRDVFAFLPFQTTNTRFVIPIYVMTRNVVRDYKPDAPTDPTRFDLPAERYRLEIGGLDGIGATASLLDPATGEAKPVTVVSAGLDQITVDVQVTDSPRLLTIQEIGLDSSQPEDLERAPAGVGEVPGEEEGPTEGGEDEGSEEEPGPGGDPEEEQGEDEGESEDPGEDGDGGVGREPDRASPRTPETRDEQAPEEANVNIALQRPRALLKTGLIKVTGNCEPKCRLLIGAHLTIANHRPYRLFQRPRRVGAATENPNLTLGISLREAKIAQRALLAGAPLKLVVGGRAEFGVGFSHPVAKTIVLRR